MVHIHSCTAYLRQCFEAEREHLSVTKSRPEVRLGG